MPASEHWSIATNREEFLVVLDDVVAGVVPHGDAWAERSQLLVHGREEKGDSKRARTSE